MDISQLKTLKAVRDYISIGEFERLRKVIAPRYPQRDLVKRLRGLTEEDLFIRLSRLSGTLAYATRFDQEPLVPSDYIPADFLCHFRPSRSLEAAGIDPSEHLTCLVEVKTTETSGVRIGGQELKRRRAFAELLGLPLLVAARFTQFRDRPMWVIKSDSKRRSTCTVKASWVDEDLRPLLWDDYLLAVPLETKFISVWSKDANITQGAEHPKYGRLAEFRIEGHYGSRALEGLDAMMYRLFFEVFDLSGPTRKYRNGLVIETASLRWPIPSCLELLNWVDLTLSHQSKVDGRKVMSETTTVEGFRLTNLRPTMEILVEEMVQEGLIVQWVNWNPEELGTQWLALKGREFS